jgi:hypothetical protein
LLKVWPAGKPSFARWLVWNGTISTSVGELNDWLQDLNSPDRGIEVVDLFKKAGLNNSDGLYRDTLHFKPEVYERLRPILVKELIWMLSTN